MERTWERIAPSTLALLLDIESLGETGGEEQAQLLRQQLAAPLLPDLLIVPGVERDRLTRLARDRGTFFEELMSTAPSLEVLRAIKHFARYIKTDRLNPLHGEAADVLYFAAIAAALVRCDQRITSLDDHKLREALRSVAGRETAGELRPLFMEAIRAG